MVRDLSHHGHKSTRPVPEFRQLFSYNCRSGPALLMACDRVFLLSVEAARRSVYSGSKTLRLFVVIQLCLYMCSQGMALSTGGRIRRRSFCKWLPCVGVLKRDSPGTRRREGSNCGCGYLDGRTGERVLLAFPGKRCQRLSWTRRRAPPQGAPVAHVTRHRAPG